MKKYLFPLIAAAALVWMHSSMTPQAGAQVQPPKLLLNWQATTYTLPEFPGKVMPTAGSVITIGVDLIDQGKRVDISNSRVFWYLNDVFYQGSSGLTQITINAPRIIGATSIKVRAYLPDYGAGPARSVDIPIVSPEAVIQSSAPSLSASAVPFRLQAYPYFFNIQTPSQLNFSWSLNGKTVGTQNPLVVTREMAQNGSARLELTVRNPASVIERTTKEVILFRQ